MTDISRASARTLTDPQLRAAIVAAYDKVLASASRRLALMPCDGLEAEEIANSAVEQLLKTEPRPDCTVVQALMMMSRQVRGNCHRRAGPAERARVVETARLEAARVAEPEVEYARSRFEAEAKQFLGRLHLQCELDEDTQAAEVLEGFRADLKPAEVAEWANISPEEVKLARKRLFRRARRLRATSGSNVLQLLQSTT